MSLPPLGTLLLENVAELGPEAVLGIDTQFFTVKNLLKGVKLIPQGLHFLHYSEALDKGSAVRSGWWFYCGDQSVVTWDIKAEASAPPGHVDMHSLGLFYPYMAEYPEDPKRWAELTRFLDLEAVDEYVANTQKSVSTATPSSEENMVLLDVLRQKDPSQTFSSEQDELRYTIIQSHKRRPDAALSDITGDFLDRSWYLESLFGHDCTLLLAELQLSFVHFLILGNLCSLTQWVSLLLLVSSSRSFVEKNSGFRADFMRLLEAQIACFPPEYMAPASASQIVDMEKYYVVLGNLAELFGAAPAWTRVRQLHESRFGIFPPKSSVFDAENFEVYDLENHDSADEDAPAVV